MHFRYHIKQKTGTIVNLLGFGVSIFYILITVPVYGFITLFQTPLTKRYIWL